jgi:TorA maturation chaperone TorD
VTASARRVAQLADSPRDLAAAFLYLHDLFRAPTHDQWTWLVAEPTRAFHRRLAELAGLPHAEFTLGLPSNASNYESEYIAAFDSGAPHAPVPLIESHYNRRMPVPKVLHENILFYQSFGLQLRSSANETADHLRHQLEFVAHLLSLEADELARRATIDGQRGDGTGSQRLAADDPPTGSLAEVDLRLAQLRRARGEFLSRRLAHWVPKAAAAGQRLPWVWVGRCMHLVQGVVACAQPAAGVAP